jgi:glycolate oxidase FAD binding subunit
MTVDLDNSLAGLDAIVGAEYLRPAEAHDAVDGQRPRAVVEPGNADEVAQVLRYAAAAGLSIAPRGGGTKMGWGNAARRVDVLVSLRRLNRVLEHAWADMTATAEAGCSVARFQSVLAEHGQCLAADALWPERATIGGALATNDSGALRVRFGGLRDLVIGVTVALSDGTVARSGGKVVKNVAGYDLPKLFTGSFGTLGVITEATFRLHPLARAARTLSFTTATPDAANKLALAVHDSPLAPTGLQLRLRSDAAPQLDVRFEGFAPAVEAQAEQLLRLASGVQRLTSRQEVWSVREEIWEGKEPALVCKFGVLPARLGEFAESVRQAAAEFKADWQLVAQSIGVGLLRLEGEDSEALLSIIEALRDDSAPCECSLVLLQCAPEAKSRVDVWGPRGVGALPLMRRIKERFDPAGILNPGRFVGGI